MPSHCPRSLRIAFLALAVLGCGDDSPSSNTSANEADAGDHDHDHDHDKDAAADSGKTSSPRNSEKTDAGRPAQPDKKDASKSEVSDAEQAVTLRFRAQVGDAAFACGSVYKDQGNTRKTVTPRDLRLFIQDVALIDESGRDVPLKLDTRDPWQTPDVALLDFEDSTGDCLGSPETNHEITGVVPKGKYVALRFSHGIPEMLNHSDPKTFPPPLKTPGMTWNWLLGFRFIKFEMGTQAGPDADLDAGADPGSFSLHVGSTACAGSQSAGTITCGKPNRSKVELKNFDIDKSEIVLDLSGLLSGSDLSTTVECHSGTPNCEAMFKALGVDYATGKPTPDAPAYRLK